jgi:prefoldin subunit 5
MLSLIKKYKKDLEECKASLSDKNAEMESGEYNDYRECSESIGYYEGRIEGLESVIADLEELDSEIDTTLTKG